MERVIIDVLGLCCECEAVERHIPKVMQDKSTYLTSQEKKL